MDDNPPNSDNECSNAADEKPSEDESSSSKEVIDAANDESDEKQNDCIVADLSDIYGITNVLEGSRDLMCGVKFNKGAGKWIHCGSNQLTSFSDAVALSKPSMADHVITFNFYDETRFNQFMTATESASINISDLIAEYASNGVSNTFKSIVRENEQEEILFAKCVLNVAPTAACSIHPFHLNLSESAIEKLKDIEMNLHQSDVKDAIEEFFHQFGSHAIAGISHFGGVHIATDYAKTDIFCDIQETQEKTESVSINPSILTTNEDSLNDQQSEASNDSLASGDCMENTKPSEEIDVTASTKQIGGPFFYDTLDEWQQHLKQNYRTWSVIDYAQDRVPLWELVRTNKQHFRNSDTFADKLKCIWQELTGMQAEAEISQQCRNAIVDLLELMRTFNDEVAKRGLSVDHWQQRLQQLCEKVDILEKLPDAQDQSTVWIQNALFHQIVVAIIQEFPDSRRIARVNLDKPLLHLLWKSGERDFPMKQQVRDELSLCRTNCQIGLKQYTILAPMKVSCPIKLAQELDDNVLPDMKLYLSCYAGDSEKIREIREMFHCDITAAVQCVVDQLQLAADVHVHFVTCIAFATNGYSVTDRQFKVLLDVDKVANLANSLRKNVEQLHKLRNSCSSSEFANSSNFLQANLITMATNANSSELCGFCKKDWNHLFFSSKSIWTNKLKRKLEDFCSNKADWVNLHEKANRMLTKFSETGELLNLPQIAVQQLLDVYNYSYMQQPVVTVRDNYPNDDSKLNEILNILGLTDKYPGGLCLRDVMTISDDHRNSKVTDVKQIPLKLLKAFVQADYQAGRKMMRELLTQCDDQSKDTKDDIFADDDDENNEIDQFELHYSDVTLASVLCCNMRLQQLVAEKLHDCKQAFPFASVIGGVRSLRVWPLRSFRCEFLTAAQKGTVQSFSADCDEFPIISFVRLGYCSISKSNLINHCLSKKHKVFGEFSQQSARRLISDGSVELAWAIPDASNDALELKQVTCLLNLRGDAMEHQQQLNLLLCVSSCIVVLLPDNDANQESQLTSVLAQILQQQQQLHVILLRTGSCVLRSLRQVEAEVKCLKQNQKFDAVNCWHQKQQLAVDLIAEKLSKIISDVTLSNINRLDVVGTVCASLNWSVDELQSAAADSLGTALDLVQKIDVNADLADCREYLLPLSSNLWQQISKFNKLNFRGSRSGDSNEWLRELNKIRNKIGKLRHRQFQMLRNQLNDSTSYTYEFVTKIGQMKDSSMCELMLQRLKLSLDSLCRRKLPQVNQEYQQAIHDHRIAQAEGKSDLVARRKDVVRLEKKLQDSAFGLEQIYREIGQVFEAVHHNGNQNPQLTKTFTSLAARLLLLGQPLEIMDGNATSCAVDWVTAVLNELESMLDSKSVIVVAVVGLQSSGKSTLLNSMFGLQLAVSAGRCTKGAFLQLVPNDRQKSQLDADYVAIIDSEGLRSLEFGDNSKIRDNEMATFIIGLADITIINIMGEGLTDIRDILQMVTHALLRMKAISEDLIKQKACLFVHQNVSAVNAADETKLAKQKLLTQLDESTRAVAKEEKLSVRQFTDVINLGDNSVYFLPHLWEGKPPMAPVSAEYCHDVIKVKDNILNQLSQLTQCSMSFTDLSVRIRDLWKAVLTEDFVFSFQNTLELNAFKDVDDHFAKLKMKVDSAASDWICNPETTACIRKCNNLAALNKKFGDCEFKLKEFMNDKQEHVLKEMSEFINNHRHKEICKKWEQERLNELRSAVKGAVDNTVKHLEIYREQTRLRLRHEKNAKEYETELAKKVKQLAKSKEGEVLSEDLLNQEFESLWNEFMLTVVADESEKWDGNNVYTTALFNHFKDQTKILKDELDKQHRNDASVTESIADSFCLSSICEDDFSDSWSFKRRKTWFKTKKTLTPHVRDLCFKVLKGADEILLKFNEQEPKLIFRNLIDDLILCLKTSIREPNQEGFIINGVPIQLKPIIAIKMAVHACIHVNTLLKLKQNEIDRQHGLKTQLQKLKEKYFSLFKNLYKKETDEVIAAGLIVSSVQEIVTDCVMTSARNAILQKLKYMYEGNKRHLIYEFMSHLARERNFDEFNYYIKNSKSFAQFWLYKKMQMVLNGTNDAGNNEFHGTIDHYTVEMINKAKCGFKDAADTCSIDTNSQNLRAFIGEFCKSDSNKSLGISETTFNEELFSIDLIELPEFVDLLNSKLMDSKNKTINEVFTRIKRGNWNGCISPHTEALEQLWGCAEQCPMCDEPCINTSGCSGSSSKHQCLMHRPGATTGWFTCTNDGIVTGVMLGNCSYAVAANGLFWCGFGCEKTAGRCKDYVAETYSNGKVKHYFRDLHKIFPNWEIPPDADMSRCNYWKWFLFHFREELTAYYEWEVCDIPDDYGKISVDNAIESLSVYYKN